MSRVDPSDPKIKEAFDDVKNDDSPTNWLLLDYVPKTTKLRLVGTGEDGWDEMCDELSDGKVLYGLCRFRINEIYRYAYLSWCGEGVQGMLRGLLNNHAVDMQYVFQGYHVQHNARYEDDLDESLVLSKLSVGIGANYDAGGIVQGTKSESKPSAAKQVEKKPLINSEESTKFWDSQGEVAPQSGYKKDLDFKDKAKDREEFWSQQQKEDAARETASHKTKVDINTSASSLKSRFEQLAEEQKVEVPVPAPRTAAPRKFKAPVAIPKDEPVQESYAEESYPEESYAEESYAEEAYEEESYAEEAYEEEGYAEEAYEEEGYAEESYAEESYPEEAAAEESYPEESYAEEAYEEEGYAEEGYAEEGYAEESYAEEAYEEEGYAEEAYEEEGYEEYAEEEYYEEEGYAEGAGISATALYDYAGQSADDLVFNAGDVIEVLDQSDPSGWWKGSLNGAEGYFPSNFVQAN